MVFTALFKERFSLSKLLKTDWLALLLILTYLLLLAPYSLNFIFYMPDERHYADAAMYMLKHGGYLSPINPDGGYRFMKPIFTYWVVLASYALFGISEFSTRFPFLLAAGMVIRLTYRTTLLAFRSRETALLALLIVGSTPVLHRSTPLALTDLLFLIFLQLIIYGTVGLLVSADRKPRFFWYLYAGAGMAVMTKGLPAIVFLSVALFYLVANPWRRLRLREVVHFPSMLTGLVLGGFWYVAIFFIHGPEAVFSFWEDQVGIRISDKIVQIAKNLVLSVLAIVLMMFPFMLAGWRGLIYRLKLKTNPKVLVVLGFSIVWGLAMVGMASFVSKFYYRYLIPVLPVLAMAMAWLIWSNHQKSGTLKMMKTGLFISFTLFLLVNLSGIVVVCLFYAPVWYYLVFALNILISSWLFLKNRRKSILRQSILIYWFMAGIFYSLYFVIRPISAPTNGQQIVQKLNELNISSGDSIQFFGHTRIASNLRVVTKGEYFFIAYKQEEAEIRPETRVVVFPDSFIEELNLENFDLVPASYVWSEINPGEIWAVKNRNELFELKKERSDIYYIGIRKSSKKN